jgi:hypothetical protein
LYTPYRHETVIIIIISIGQPTEGGPLGKGLGLTNKTPHSKTNSMLRVVTLALKLESYFSKNVKNGKQSRGSGALTLKGDLVKRFRNHRIPQNEMMSD